MRALYNEAQTSHPTICCTEVKGGCCIGLIVAYCLRGKRRVASLNENRVRVIVVYKKGFFPCVLRALNGIHCAVHQHQHRTMSACMSWCRAKSQHSVILNQPIAHTLFEYGMACL